MENMGQPIYVEVSAEMVNSGIMTMAASGGEEGATYWINWNQNGFISQGWFWGDQNVPLSVNWGNYPYSGYGTTQEEFMRYIEEVNPDNLNAWLGSSWTNEMKWNFIQQNLAVFTGCTSVA